jgi:hypothetical protein
MQLHTGISREEYNSNLKRLQAGEEAHVVNKHGVISRLYLKDGKMYDTDRSEGQESDPEVIVDTYETAPLTVWGFLHKTCGPPVEKYADIGLFYFRTPEGERIPYASFLENVIKLKL